MNGGEAAFGRSMALGLPPEKSPPWSALICARSGPSAAIALTSMAALSAHVSLIACRKEVGKLVRFHVALQIFIRTNNGGTKLSYSDLLLSFATANWKTRPALASRRKLSALSLDESVSWPN